VKTRPWKFLDLSRKRAMIPALFERTILRETVFLESKRRKMGGANFTSSRTEKTL